MKTRLADLEFWLVAGAVLVSMVYIQALHWSAALCGAVFLLRVLLQRQFTVRTSADWGVLLLLCMAGISLWVTELPDVTQPQFLRLLTGIALCYAVVNWADSQMRVLWLVLGLSIAGFGLAISAPLTVEWTAKLPFFPASLYERFGVLVVDTIHPNVLAGVLAILAPFPLALSIFGGVGRSGWARPAGGVCFLGMLAAIVLTQSRGAWLATAVMLVLMVTLRWRSGWLSISFGGMFAGILVYRLGFPQLLDTIAASNTLGGFDLRVEFWSRAIYMLQDFAFTGIGMGSFGRVADLLYPFFLLAPGRAEHAHNLFLQIGVDLGLPGLVAWLAILLAVISAAWVVYRTGRLNRNDLAAGVGAAALASMVALVVHGMLDAVVWGMVRPAPVVWAIWGLTLASANLYYGINQDWFTNFPFFRKRKS